MSKLSKNYFMTLQRPHGVHAGFSDESLTFLTFVVQKL